MNVDFWNGYYFNEFYTFITDETSFNVKAIYISNTNSIIVNLGAFQWSYLDENSLIIELCKSITHETIHYVLDTECIKNKYEENICQILSGQL